MPKYHESRCSRCNGSGIARFLWFKRVCPSCGGTGVVRVSQYTFKLSAPKTTTVAPPTRKSQLMFVSELNPGTRAILKKNPQLLLALSQENRTALMRKYGKDLHHGAGIDSGGPGPDEPFKRFVKRQQQQQIQRNLQQQRQLQQQSFQQFVNRAMQQHQDFSNWSRQQQQNWSNQQFNSFANQFNSHRR